MADTYLGGRIEASRRMGVVALGDALAIAAFVAAGEARHAGTLAAGVETFLQFGIGWALAAVALYAYTARALSSPRRAAALALGTWIVGALLGQAIRLLTEASAGFSVPFVLVSIGTGGALLVIWRFVAARHLRSDAGPEGPAAA